MNNGIILRQEKGEPLTHEELDNNFRICDNSYTQVHSDFIDGDFVVTLQKIIDTLGLNIIEDASHESYIISIIKSDGEHKYFLDRNLQGDTLKDLTYLPIESFNEDSLYVLLHMQIKT